MTNLLLENSNNLSKIIDITNKITMNANPSRLHYSLKKADRPFLIISYDFINDQKSAYDFQNRPLGFQALFSCPTFTSNLSFEVHSSFIRINFSEHIVWLMKIKPLNRDRDYNAQTKSLNKIINILKYFIAE